MIKKTTMVMLGVALIFGFAGVSVAGEKGNKRKGKYLFRKYCRTCHKDGASAKVLSPDSKTQAQWERAFRKEKYSEYKCYAGAWKDKSEQELLDILTYLHAHAFDSPSPATCK